MLPDRNHPDFPTALKRARNTMNLTLTELAKKAGISSTMPGRYENTKSSLFTAPSQETWRKLNNALFPSTISTNTIQNSLLEDASIDELVQQLKNKGVKSVSLDF